MTEASKAELIEAIRANPALLLEEMQELAMDDRRGSADLLFRDPAGRLHLVFVRSSPELQDVGPPQDAAATVRAEGDWAIGWLVGPVISPEVEDMAIEAGVRTRQIDIPKDEVPLGETTPAPAAGRWPGRHALRRSVPEHEALTELGPLVGRLIANLTRRGWEINHGGHQTQVVYKGHAVGGVNRKYGHACLSKLIGPLVGEDHLRSLGFKVKSDPKQRGAYSGHTWFEVRVPRDLDPFEQALEEIQALIDRGDH